MSVVVKELPFNFALLSQPSFFLSQFESDAEELLLVPVPVEKLSSVVLFSAGELDSSCTICVVTFKAMFK